jgi:hypothetical protein
LKFRFRRTCRHVDDHKKVLPKLLAAGFLAASEIKKQLAISEQSS